MFAEQISRQATCTFFISFHPLKSRAEALALFCDLVLGDYNEQELEPFVRVFIHHTASRKCFEIINSDTYERSRCDLSALRQEFEWYRSEKISAAIAIHNVYQSGLLRIYPSYKGVKAVDAPDGVIFLADDYWLFTRIRRVTNMTA